MTQPKMKLTCVCLPELYVEGLDLLVKDNVFASRSSAIRSAIKDLINNDQKFLDQINKKKSRSRRKMSKTLNKPNQVSPPIGGSTAREVQV
jgi:antitoxin ParD1/3/4